VTFALHNGFTFDGVRCDRCGAEESQPDMINGAVSVIAEGSWAFRDEDDHLCPECVTPNDLRAGWRRN
jgi:hypothetical protein